MGERAPASVDSSLTEFGLGRVEERAVALGVDERVDGVLRSGVVHHQDGPDAGSSDGW